jgi:reverse gyrase
MTLKNTVANELLQEFLKETGNTQIDTFPMPVQDLIFERFITQSMADIAVKSVMAEAIKGVL